MCLWSPVGSLHVLLLPLWLQGLLSECPAPRGVVQTSPGVACKKWILYCDFLFAAQIWGGSWLMTLDIAWDPKGPKRARQTCIEVDMATALVEIAALSFVFQYFVAYWVAHLSGDCNISWLPDSWKSTDHCIETQPGLFDFQAAGALLPRKLGPCIDQGRLRTCIGSAISSTWPTSRA